MESMTREASALLPSLKMLNGSGMPSNAQRKVSRIGYTDKTEWKSATDVDYHAGKVLEWLKNCKNSRLRGAINIMSASGLTYSASVDHQVLMAYYKHGDGISNLAADAKARLCQAGEPKPAPAREDYATVFGS